jgi:hypothetical protein
VRCIGVAFVLEDLEVRRRDLQSAAPPVLDAAEEHEALFRFQHVLQVRLIGPHGLHLATAVLHEGSEERKTRPARRGDATRQHLAEDRHGGPRAQRRNRLEAAAIFVAARQAEEQVLDGPQAGTLEIGGLAGSDALQELKRRLQGIAGHAAAVTERPSPAPS